MDELAEQAVDAINAISGRHDGHRAAHAKGILLSGTFTASPEARSFTTAAHMRGEPVRTTVRFSNGAMKPDSNDAGIGEGRGLAVKFYLPDGGTTDLVMLSMPVFFVRTPEEFLEFTLARAESMAKMGEFIGSYPDTLEAVQQIAPRLIPPRSYATVAYNSIHAFRLVDAEGNGRWIRWRWVPEAGSRTCPRRNARAPIATTCRRRSSRACRPLRRSAVLAEDGDPLEDPTKAWPEERETVDIGRWSSPGPRHEREQRRRRAGLRPHAGHRGHRAERRPGPALPPAGLRGVGHAPKRRSGARVINDAH